MNFIIGVGRNGVGVCVCVLGGSGWSQIGVGVGNKQGYEGGPFLTSCGVVGFCVFSYTR